MLNLSVSGHSSRASADSSSASSGPSPATEILKSSIKSNRTPSASLCLSIGGRVSHVIKTCAPLTDESSSEPTSSLEASLVRTCPPQAEALASAVLAVVCGGSSLASSTKPSPSGSSSRTSLAELAAGSPKYDAPWTSSAMTAFRSRLARAIAEHLIDEDESSLWPTPTASAYGTTNNGCPQDGRQQYATAGTPSLNTLAKTWPYGTRQGWPTPTTSDAKHSRRHGYMLDGNSGTTLLDAVLIFNGDGPLDPKTSKAGRASSPTAVLNPAFVEALLGLPVGFTAVGSEHSATASARLRRASSGVSSDD